MQSQEHFEIIEERISPMKDPNNKIRIKLSQIQELSAFKAVVPKKAKTPVQIAKTKLAGVIKPKVNTSHPTPVQNLDSQKSEDLIKSLTRQQLKFYNSLPLTYE